MTKIRWIGGWSMWLVCAFLSCKGTTPPAPSVTPPAVTAPSTEAAPLDDDGGDAEEGPAEELPRCVTLPRPRLLWRKTGEKVAFSMPPSRGVKGFSWTVDGDAIVVQRDGLPLWREPGAATRHGEPFAHPVLTAARAYILKPKELIARELASGHIVSRWPLPMYLEGRLRGFGTMLVADGARAAVLVRSLGSLEGILVSWNGAAAPVVLDRPMVIAQVGVLQGHTLFLHNDADKVVGAYDLDAIDPPLASLAPRAAMAAVEKELVGEERLVCDRLALLNNLHETWLEIAGRAHHPLWACAISRLTQDPRASDGVVLRRVVQQSMDEDDRRLVVQALSKNDNFETSELLAHMIEEPPGPSAHSRWISKLTVDAAYEQLWRTGRTSTFGACPPRPLVHRVAELAQPSPDGSVGTAHPLLFQQIARDGSWCLICQARADTNGDGQLKVVVGHHGEVLGDDMIPYLVVGSGSGWPVDDFIAAGPNGRYVAVRQKACLEIVDTRSAQVTTLPEADLRDEGTFGPHRGAAFDPHGQRMLYFRGGSTNRVVLRELASASERSIDAGKGLVWNARFDPEGQWIQMTIAPSGEWRHLATTLAPRQCRGVPMSYSVFGGGSIPTVVRLVSLHGGATYEGADIVSPFGANILVRERDGALSVRSPTGVETVLVPASCAGRLVHADPKRGSVLAACSPHARGQRWSLWLFGPDGGRDLGQAIDADGDDWTQSPERIVHLQSFYVDMDAKTTVRAPPIAPRAVHEVEDWRDREKGMFAERGDGSVLAQDPAASPESFDVPRGPLRWRRP